MACPRFRPESPLPGAASGPRVSLIEVHSGVCDATATAPDERALRENCNHGYASGRCPHIAADDADAVRFAIAERDAGPPRVRYILEKEHVPVELGWADEAPPGSPVEAQGRAFLSLWLRRARRRAHA